MQNKVKLQTVCPAVRDRQIRRIISSSTLQRGIVGQENICQKNCLRQHLFHSKNKDGHSCHSQTQNSSNKKNIFTEVLSQRWCCKCNWLVENIRLDIAPSIYRKKSSNWGKFWKKKSLTNFFPSIRFVIAKRDEHVHDTSHSMCIMNKQTPRYVPFMDHRHLTNGIYLPFQSLVLVMWPFWHT